MATAGPTSGGATSEPETAVTLGGGRVSVADVAAVASGAPVRIDSDARELLARSRAVVDSSIGSGQPVYGLTTRLGAGRDMLLREAELIDFQKQVIANHLGGIGEPLPGDEVRALMFARLASFTRGGAGVRPELAASYLDLLNSAVEPVVPTRGSVGAGDLSHLAAVAAVLIGTGEASVNGNVRGGAQALAVAGLTPVNLAPGEALALLSGNSYSTGVGCLAVRQLTALAGAADRTVALTLEALGANGSGGNLSPFDHAVQSATGRVGQADAAASVRALLSGSALAEPGRSVTVQDPLSVRTTPQLHGALRDLAAGLTADLETELNARSENPLVDIDSGRMLSGGNFQIVSLAVVLDSLRVVLAHLASASERRIALLSDLARPLRVAGVAPVPGLLGYSAAATLAELRHLAAPASVSGASLSGVEDQATHAPLALQLLQRSIRLTAEVLAIEALHAAQLLAEDAALGSGTAALLPGLRDLFALGLPASGLVTATVAHFSAP
jgi:histidine ammonia-lyase